MIREDRWSRLLPTWTSNTKALDNFVYIYIYIYTLNIYINMLYGGNGEITSEKTSFWVSSACVVFLREYFD